MTNDEARNEWENEKKRAEEFFKAFKDNLDKARQEREKNDPVYKPEDVLFGINTGTFQHDFKYEEEVDVPSIMANAPFDAFEATRNAFLQWKSNYEKVINAKEPKRDDFFAESNFNKAHNDWLWEKTDAYDFALYFGSALDDLQQKKTNADPKYKWFDLVWNSSTLNYTTSETGWIAQKDLLQHDVTALEEALINELPDYNAQTSQAIMAKAPIKDQFFLPQNYVDALDQWKENINRLAAFVKRIGNALKKAIKTLNQQAQANANTASPQPTAQQSTLIIDVPQGFPDNPDSLKVVKGLGGSTGAELVEAPDGTRYVRKRGNNEGHIRSECYADAFYRAAGADVPEFRLYDTKNGPVKLSRYYEGTKSLNEWWNKASKKQKDAMSVKLREQYAVDVLLGNWDVVGMNADNILIDKDGKPWRIDNGGSLSYRAQGGTKDNKDWNDGFIDDLWTMTGNGARIGNSASSNIPTYYGQLDVGEIAKQINDRDWTEALKRLPADQRAIAEKRLEEVKQLAAREEDFRTNGFTRDFTLSILDETYMFSKKGLREACSFTCDLEHDNYGWFRSNSGSTNLTPEQQKDADMQDTLLLALKTINYNTPKGQPLNQSKINAALALKQDIQDAVAKGLPNATHYQTILDDIETAVANNTTTKKNNYDLKKPMYAAQQTTQTATTQLQTQYESLSKFLRAEMGDDAVNYIEDCNHSQGGDSYDVNTGKTADACKTKILRLRAQGYDFNKYKTFDDLYKDATAAGYYLGIPNDPNVGWQYDNIEKAFNFFKNNKTEYDKRYDEMTRYNAALQIALENVDFTGNDKTRRQVLLGRTERKKEVIDSVSTVKVGEKCTHRTGVNESHFVWRTVTVKGHELTMARVPYSRINGFYMMESHCGSMYLGDSENEISADTHGLPIYYVQASINRNQHISKFMKKFIDAEKKNP